MFELIVVAAIIIPVVVWSMWRASARAEFIRRYAFPMGLFEKLRKRHPSLALKDCQLVGHALRQYFLAHLKSGRKLVSMPSQVADDLWHELILYTRTYDQFCKRAFGRFMHHTPAAVLGSARTSNAGLRRCWWYVCLEENINPRNATRLPLLFALDAKLNIVDGFRYVADCSGLKEPHADTSRSKRIHCGSDFSSSDFDGTLDGFGDSTADGDGGGGGCGGD